MLLLGWGCTCVKHCMDWQSIKRLQCGLATDTVLFTLCLCADLIVRSCKTSHRMNHTAPINVLHTCLGLGSWAKKLRRRRLIAEYSIGCAYPDFVCKPCSCTVSCAVRRCLPSHEAWHLITDTGPAKGIVNVHCKFALSVCSPSMHY